MYFYKLKKCFRDYKHILVKLLTSSIHSESDKYRKTPKESEKKNRILFTGMPLLKMESWKSKIQRGIQFIRERNDKSLLTKYNSVRNFVIP